MSGLAQLTTAVETSTRGDASGKMLVDIWYPVESSTPVSQKLLFAGPPGKPFFDAGSFASGAPLADSPRAYPLIVLSHGTGGTGMQMAWLARVLAEHGYIVAAPNHPGNNGLDKYTPQGFVLWWLRARDLSTTIDAMLADPRFGSHIDRSRIAAAGFSLGGYTMMEIAGARTSVHQFAAACKGRDGDPTCAGPPEFPNLDRQVHDLMQTDAAFRAAMAGDGASYRDPRVRAVFAIAPALGMAVIQASLQAIDIPVKIVVGTKDPIVPGRINGQRFARAIPGAEFEWIPDAVHYTFLDECTSAGAAALPQLCAEPGGADRAEVHARVAADVLAFMNRSLH